MQSVQNSSTQPLDAFPTLPISLIPTTHSLTQRPAKASCTSVVRSARAVVEELPAAAESSVGLAARCRDTNAETDFHKLAKACGLLLPVEMSHVSLLDGEKVGVLFLSSWAKCLLNLNLWHTVSGLDHPDDDRCCAQWGLFWERYRCLAPEHPVFSERSLEELQRTAAVLLHGDEGRSRKKTAIMILSAHSALGQGSQVDSDRKSVQEYAKQELNFRGHTWATRWLMALLPRSMYDEEKAGNFQMLLGHLVEDMQSLHSQGIRSPITGRMHYMCVLNVMGDWPFLAKAFTWTRSFGNAAKAETSKKAGTGICHLCLADRPGFPFEDFHSPEPRWRSTLNTVVPYTTVPVLMRLPHDPRDPGGFAGQDYFHGFHLGAGKIFVASALALISADFPGNSYDSRFKAMEQDFFAWCGSQKVHPYIRKFTRETLSWPVATAAPSGAWSKGSTTLALLRWFLHLCAARRATIEAGTLLHVAWSAAWHINKFFSMLYREKLWIEKEKALEISGHGFRFLALNSTCARLAFEARKPFFTYMPNLHRLHHLFFLMRDMAAKSPFVLNGLIWCCQVEEDFIGRPSRVSRRVHPRTVIRRTLERALESAKAKYVAKGFLVPAG